MTRPDLMALAEAERTDLLSFLQTLTDTQWSAESLCSQWTVRDVALHLVSYEELCKVALVGVFLRGGLRVSSVNDIALRRYQDLDRDGILELLSRNLRPAGLTSGFRGGIALTDATIHHQDIRRALGLPRTIPPGRLVPVLNFAAGAPTLPAKNNVKGLTLTATDVDWSHGAGPKVDGPGEALLMAVSGRPTALDELDGPGLETLRSRVG